MNEFVLEKTLLEKFADMQRALNYCKVDVSRQIQIKAKSQNISIPQDLKNKMSKDMESCQSKKFFCPLCPKHFDEGRKLGGHISRAHPGHKKEQMDQSKPSGSKKFFKNSIKREADPDQSEQEFVEDQNEDEDDHADNYENQSEHISQSKFEKRKMIKKPKKLKIRIKTKCSKDIEAENRISKESPKSSKSKRQRKEKKKQPNDSEMEMELLKREEGEQIYDEDDQ